MKLKIFLSATLVACGLWLPGSVIAEGTWLPLSSSPAEGIGTMLLLSDGTVMAQGGGGGYASANWYRLSPGGTGGYTNGTWSSLATATYSRLYYASQVLTNGKVFFVGAEAGSGGSTSELFDPVNNSWSTITVPAGLVTASGFYDCDSMMLPNGKVIILPVYPVTYGGTVIYDPVANTLSAGPTTVNGYNEDEAGMVKLPDNSLLIVDNGTTTSERYIPSLNQWVADSNVPVSLFDPYGDELGPPMLLPNGKSIVIGSLPNTAIYTPTGNNSHGSWVAGPSIGGIGSPDAPAAMMFNGKILVAMSPTPTSGQHFPFPTYFYEYNYSSGSVGAFTQVHAPNGSYTNSGPTWPKRMLDLPDGTVLFTDGSAQLYVYKPDGSPIAAGKPTIYGITSNGNGTYHVTGTLFNGISQGASYGDDAQMDSNYPLIRLTSGGSVSYLRTYNWSSTSVMTGGNLVSTEFDARGVFPGTYSLQVVANGIASDPITFGGPVWVDFNYTSGFGFYFGTYDFPYNTLAAGVSAVPAGGTIEIKPGTSLETFSDINKAMQVHAPLGSAKIGGY